jgi:MSHA biogenesis protein MshP
MKHTPRTPQSGFAAIAAIFLVVLLAALGAFMVGFSNTQQLNSAQDVQGSRAYWAARGALEWAIPTVATPALCVSPMASPPTPLDGFTIRVDCVPTAYTEGIVTVNVLRLTATASIGAGVGSVGFVERSVSASVER